MVTAETACSSIRRLRLLVSRRHPIVLLLLATLSLLPSHHRLLSHAALVKLEAWLRSDRRLILVRGSTSSSSRGSRGQTKIANPEPLVNAYFVQVKQGRVVKVLAEGTARKGR